MRRTLFFESDHAEVPASYESGLLLIGASAFSVPILAFLSVSVVYLVVFLRFYPFYSLLHQTIYIYIYIYIYICIYIYIYQVVKTGLVLLVPGTTNNSVNVIQNGLKIIH